MASNSTIVYFCSDESDDEDDDEAELQAELQRIKDERELANARKAQEEAELELRLSQEGAMRGNPLALIEENSAKVRRSINACFIYLLYESRFIQKPHHYFCVHTCCLLDKAKMER